MKNIILVLMLTSCVAIKDKLSNFMGSSSSLPKEEYEAIKMFGYASFAQLQQLNLTDAEKEAFLAGAKESLYSKKPFDPSQIMPYQGKIQAFVQKKQMEMMEKAQKEAQKFKEEGEKFITDFLAKNSNAKKTESGLVYEIINPGTGKSPSVEDSITVHYHGTLINGEVFDSSMDRAKQLTSEGKDAEQAKFKADLASMIPGWKEALPLLKEGGKMKLIVPSQLAYGDRPAGKIPPGSTLIFDIELFKVEGKAPVKKAPIKK